MQANGHLRKLTVQLDNGNVIYHLPLDTQQTPLNPLLGQTIQLHYSGAIHCIYCGRFCKTSFQQGYCYPCFKKLARCDSCMVSPERCHYFAGTCREPAWGEQYCLKDHIVYLANTSGLKVGITRAINVPMRWIDQGAVQALPIMRVSNRLQSGEMESVFKHHVADKTNWRVMLKGDNPAIDLAAQRDHLFTQCATAIQEAQERFGVQAIQLLHDADVVSINYPVEQYPSKITSFNFDKQTVVEGQLMGIKGQYLILDSGVINIRRFAAYDVQLTV